MDDKGNKPLTDGRRYATADGTGPGEREHWTYAEIRRLGERLRVVEADNQYLRGLSEDCLKRHILGLVHARDCNLDPDHAGPCDA